MRNANWLDRLREVGIKDSQRTLETAPDEARVPVNITGQV
jgi:hypothetical protein